MEKKRLIILVIDVPKDSICERCGGVLKWWDWLFNRHICLKYPDKGVDNG